MINLWYKFLTLFGYQEYYRLGGAVRSPKWRQVRNEFIKNQPYCSACGKTENLTVHHILPFSLFPEKELLKDNFIVLCEGKTVNCHYFWGHCLLSWKCYNRSVVEDIKIVKQLQENAKFKQE